MKQTDDSVMWIGYELNKRYDDVLAFTTTRHGGVSLGNYATLNCNAGNGDVTEHIAENRRRLCRALPATPRTLILPTQTHGTRVAVIDEHLLSLDENLRAERLKETDALITAVRDVCIAVSTADCIPVLLYDKKRKVVAAVHAGWRGMVGKIITHTIEQMITLYGTVSADVEAIIAPGISLSAFEVGEEVYRAFAAEGFPMTSIARKYDKWHIDLWQAACFLLEECGVPTMQIEQSGICTYTEHERFFSARRLGIHSGRITSGIMLV